MAKKETAEVRLDAANDTYEIGAEIDGGWISFGSVHGAQVRAVAANAQANAEPAEPDNGSK